jgi:aspartate racemase
VAALVEATVDRTPAAPAVEHGDRVLTYAELDEAANRLAAHLGDLGVTPGDRVGLAFGRSLELPIALLATLKAGAVCVPLDPAYPAERLSYMVDDSGAAVVLTTAAVAVNLPTTSARLVRVDDADDGAAIAARSGERPSVSVGPSDPAYLLYTSGSTGRPRGVVLGHAGLVNHHRAAVDLYGVTAADRVLQFASISFDISVEEVFVAWAAGATIVLRPDELPIGGPEFLDWLTARRITVLDLPTAFWHEWVHDVSTQQRTLPPSLRTLIVGGERAQSGAYASWLRIGGDQVRWFNTYGPTEASIIVTAWPLQLSVDDAVPANIPIGRPIAGTHVVLLDRHGALVPVGVPGEIHIGGAGVALGYHGQPERTAEKFVPDPFAASPGARLYRTGDLAVWRPEGVLEFVGRTDDQVKIRGYRVEPGEVEEVLASHPAVREALVFAQTGEAGITRLVAYASHEPGFEPDAATLRSYLRDRLPGHMVPAAIGVLEAFPLTANGKVDRAALPALDVADPMEGTAPPRTDAERRVAKLFADLLEPGQPVGRGTDFFEAGGHSLLAVRLFGDIEREFGVRLPLSLLFHGASVAQLAAALTEPATDRSGFRSLVELKAGDGKRPPLFLGPWVAGEVLGFRELVRHLDADQPVMGFVSVGMDGTYPQRRIEDMAALYIEEMRAVQPSGPYLLGGYCFGGIVTMEMAHQLAEVGESVGLLALFDVTRAERTRETTTWYRRELDKLSKLFSAKGLDRIGWLTTRAKNLQLKVDRRLFWWIYDRWEPTGRALPKYLRNVRRVNARALREYRVRPVPVPLSLFRRGVEEVVDDSWYEDQLRQGVALAGVEVHIVAGPEVTHRALMDEPVVVDLARSLQQVIDRTIS